MSKVFYLNQNSSCEVTGTTNVPLLSSTNEKQLSYLAKRLSLISSDEFSVVCAFKYLPKHCKNIAFITNSESDYDWCHYEILDQFLEIENSKDIIEKSFLSHEKIKNKENCDSNVNITKLPIMHEINRKDIHDLLSSVDYFYLLSEAHNKSESKAKKDGTYWINR
jgi:hypothetical protein